MGARIGQIVCSVCMLACAGCGSAIHSLATPPTSLPSSLTPSAEVPTPEVAPPYVEAGTQLQTLARQFVTTALTYDACTEERDPLAGRIGDLATPAEARRLRRSGRAHLRWWALCQRNERSTVRVTGVSEETARGERHALHVEVLRTTRSDVSTVRDFVDLSLVVVRSPAGWRVDRAEGGGL